MKSPEEKKTPTFEEIVTAAKEERWNFVDENLAETVNNPEVTRWALNDGLNDEDGNLRDLAASILEKSDYVLSDEEESKLLNLLENDENPYVRFRCAFALYARGDRSSKVVAKIEEALHDPATEEIAKNYLSGK